MSVGAVAKKKEQAKATFRNFPTKDSSHSPELHIINACPFLLLDLKHDFQRVGVLHVKLGWQARGFLEIAAWHSLVSVHQQ